MIRNKMHLLNNSGGIRENDAEEMPFAHPNSKKSNRLRNEDPLSPGPVGSSSTTHKIDQLRTAKHRDFANILN